MATNIQTRIVLRNDDLSAWNTSTSPLLKGEVALAKRADGSYDLRVGEDGTKTWSQIGANVKLSSDQIIGLNATITSLSTTHYEVGSEADRTALSGSHTLVNGDTCVVKTQIADDKYSYTAYVYDKNATAWKAMDGNYDAENVYFNEDLTYTKGIGVLDNPTGSATISAKGKSLETVLKGILAKAEHGTTTDPSFTFTVAGGTGEIGTKYTVPAATLKMTSIGSYQYSPYGVTGVNVPVGNAVIKATTSGYEQELSNTAVMVANSTISTTAGTTDAETYLSGGTSYKYHAEAYYTEGAVPKNNIGDDDADRKIAAGSYKPADITATFTGYYPSYWGFSTTPTANPTAITANNANTITVDGVSMTRELNAWSKTSFTASNKWYELFYIVPAVKRSSSGWTGKDSNNVDLAADSRTEATVTFMDGTTAKYYVYVVRNAAIYNATTCTMTFK